jgi:hypothetical protein
MDHLESKRLRDLHRRNERMNRGLGSFIGGKSTLSGWQSGPHAAAFDDRSQFEGDLNLKQQSLQREQDDLASNAAKTGILPTATSVDATVPPRQNVESRPFGGSFRHIERPLENRDGILDSESPTGVFSKAGNQQRLKVAYLSMPPWKLIDLHRRLVPTSTRWDPFLR